MKKVAVLFLKPLLASIVMMACPLSVEAQQRLRVSKKLKKIFDKEGLKITLESGKDCTDYLNLYLDLKNDIYRQWRKPNSNPLYINTNSNHPPQCKKLIPSMIEKMISRNSSSKEEFDKVEETFINGRIKTNNVKFQKGGTSFTPDFLKPNLTTE